MIALTLALAGLGRRTRLALTVALAAVGRRTRPAAPADLRPPARTA